MIPVEQLRPDDELALPHGRTVLVERVDLYDDGRYVVRWHAGPYFRAPHPLAGQRHDLGSLVPMQAGDLVPASPARDPEPTLGGAPC